MLAPKKCHTPVVSMRDTCGRWGWGEILGGGDWHSLWTGAHVLVTPHPQRAETSVFSTRCAWVPVRRPLLMESGWLHAGHGGCHHSLVAGKCFSFSPAKLSGFLGKKVQPQGPQSPWDGGQAGVSQTVAATLGQGLTYSLASIPLQTIHHPFSLVMDLLVHSFNSSSI